MMSEIINNYNGNYFPHYLYKLLNCRGYRAPLLGTNFMFRNVRGCSETPQKARFAGLFCFLV
ncbi:hypothetical protein EDC90_1004103 [Martelella mediterranea]|uniref:Uncharacterized protein n=1 Tax=Martelella mediterranea TaxID=293089 RepID=A0A4R3NUX7_9HYPH|nr:hypothetical protein EDC90_1004103 [Martelella mediterranea]